MRKSKKGKPPLSRSFKDLGGQGFVHPSKARPPHKGGKRKEQELLRGLASGVIAEDIDDILDSGFVSSRGNGTCPKPFEQAAALRRMLHM